MAAKRAKERDRAGKRRASKLGLLAHRPLTYILTGEPQPITMANIVRELQGIGEERFKVRTQARMSRRRVALTCLSYRVASSTGSIGRVPASTEYACSHYGGTGSYSGARAWQRKCSSATKSPRVEGSLRHAGGSSGSFSGHHAPL